jgi:hypothetical protein
MDKVSGWPGFGFPTIEMAIPTFAVNCGDCKNSIKRRRYG